MSDRELLEAAAKAAGIKVRWHESWGCFVHVGEWYEGRPLMHKDQMVWAPNTNSGDALELAVKLRQMHIHIDAESTSAFRNDIHGMPAEFSGEPHGADPLAATRRAIVRLAAKLGGSMADINEVLAGVPSSSLGDPASPAGLSAPALRASAPIPVAAGQVREAYEAWRAADEYVERTLFAAYREGVRWALESAHADASSDAGCPAGGADALPGTYGRTDEADARRVVGAASQPARQRAGVERGANAGLADMGSHGAAAAVPAAGSAVASGTVGGGPGLVVQAHRKSAGAAEVPLDEQRGVRCGGEDQAEAVPMSDVRAVTQDATQEADTKALVVAMERPATAHLARAEPCAGRSGLASPGDLINQAMSPLSSCGAATHRSADSTPVTMHAECLVQLPDGTLVRKPRAELDADDMLVFDGPDAFASADRFQAQIEAEILAAGGFDAWRAVKLSAREQPMPEKP